MNYWDSTYYVGIAEYGYCTLPSQAFSPVFPAFIRVFDLILPRGNFWFIVSSIVVANIFGEAFVIYLYMKKGYKIAILVGLFPVFLLFSTIPYSDDIALLFLAISMESTDLIALGSFSIALATFLNLAYALPTFAFRLKRWWTFIFPATVGIIAVLLFWHYDGSPFMYFTIEKKYWGVFFGTPIIQEGSIMSSYLHYGIPSIIFLVRNYAFMSIFFVGTYLLSRSEYTHRFFLTLYCLSIEIPLMFVVGVPEFSIPRLLLPAFPALFPYASYIKKDRFFIFYIIIGTLFGVIFTIWQFRSFFA
ncbi:MAG: hypothetical protein M1375_04200 [Candidatus Thermoplasmatota archaeon]|jgi:hypothetical protein|nr:hypothetical protein [Candidatus Thermoplasmatota archaeon]MCL5791157.1 hypothetical protein [Candidatus Thermoplasmatota archaeon]